jgi:hypothetical protein
MKVFKVIVLVFFFSKACQYVIIDEKFVGISSLFQSNLPNQSCRNV